MGLVAIPFAVSLDKVKAVFGSKDAALLEKIKAAHLYDHYAGEDKGDGLFDQALEDIVFHYVWPDSGLKKNIGHRYGYALLVVCDALGTHLLPQCDGFYTGWDLEEAVTILNEKGMGWNANDMFESDNAFGLPYVNDFPAIKVFSKEEIRRINDVLDSVEIDENKTDFEKDDFDEVQLMLENLRSSFRTCKEKDVEMITFLH
ncbi:MAG: hypothetical protein J7623_16610 [Chitinophaga sp.]|uniref:DUF7691 family protein n=1 Tax=Chitinophaga sp. TaxID=1869181 RepID=UPI001B1005D2|nr:hypothetical protein [Chitinophaga sp.]MBO9730264.1 hypothetical protein [Chitinophaga sp.]